MRHAADAHECSENVAPTLDARAKALNDDTLDERDDAIEHAALGQNEAGEGKGVKYEVGGLPSIAIALLTALRRRSV